MDINRRSELDKEEEVKPEMPSGFPPIDF